MLFCDNAEDFSDLWLLKKQIALSLSFFNTQMCFILKAMGAVPGIRAGFYLSPKMGLVSLLIIDRFLL